MEKLLKELLEAEILTTETAEELQNSITAHITEAVETAKAAATAEVTAHLNEQWIAERDILIETLDEKITEVLEHELSEMKEDIERFRDLEAEKEQDVIQIKEELAAKLAEELDELVQRMDAVVEIRLTEELAEFKADIEQTRKNNFGKKMFETFAEEFKAFHITDDSIEAQLTESQQQLADAMAALTESETKNAALERSNKLRTVLTPLTGRAREVMEAILHRVDTPLLEDAYKTYIGRVLKEETTVTTDVQTSEKEDKVLAETTESKDSITGVVKTGDDTTQINESKDLDKRDAESNVVKTTISPEEKARLRRMAGL